MPCESWPRGLASTRLGDDRPRWSGEPPALTMARIAAVQGLALKSGCQPWCEVKWARPHRTLLGSRCPSGRGGLDAARRRVRPPTCSAWISSRFLSWRAVLGRDRAVEARHAVVHDAVDRAGKAFTIHSSSVQPVAGASDVVVQVAVADMAEIDRAHARIGGFERDRPSRMKSAIGGDRDRHVVPMLRPSTDWSLRRGLAQVPHALRLHPRSWPARPHDLFFERVAQRRLHVLGQRLRVGGCRRCRSARTRRARRPAAT